MAILNGTNYNAQIGAMVENDMRQFAIILYRWVVQLRLITVFITSIVAET